MPPLPPPPQKIQTNKEFGFESLIRTHTKWITKYFIESVVRRKGYLFRGVARRCDSSYPWSLEIFNFTSPDLKEFF